MLGEVYVGRAPVDTAAEAATFVGKTLNYEQNRSNEIFNAQFLAEYLGNYGGEHAHGGDGLDYVATQFALYTTNWLDDRPVNGGTWASSDCIAALNLAPHVVPHVGHADSASVMRLGIASLDSLTNSALFLVNSVGCYCGAFDHSDCIGEEFVKRNAYGAFAVLMNSRYGWFDSESEWRYSGEFMERFFHELLIRRNSNIGMANQLSKHDMLGSVETGGDMVYRWCYFEINLLGDPETAFKGEDLAVTPDTGLAPSGPAGGPFSRLCATYGLTNAGTAALSWAAGGTEAWLSLSSTGGVLASRGYTNVNVCVNTNANDLPEGTYSDTVTFSNLLTANVRQRDVALHVTPPRVHFFSLDTDPGWSGQGQWAFGVPAGEGGSYGHPDPAAGYTGSNVLGYNLSGDYTNNLTTTQWLTTSALDLSLATDVTLAFRRWLGVEKPEFDHAYVQVSNNGSAWTTVWENASEITDSSWVRESYDISSVADNRSAVYIRWGMGTTDVGWTYCGWNIDDVEIVGHLDSNDLDVTSEYGMAAPPVGQHTYAHGTNLTCMITNSPAVFSDAYSWKSCICTGWTGTGSVPEFGTNTSVDITLTNDSGITWLWAIQDLVLSNRTVTAATNYDVLNTITARDGYRIEQPGNATFRAGDAIRLAPGFTAGSGSVFRATIDPGQ